MRFYPVFKVVIEESDGHTEKVATYYFGAVNKVAARQIAKAFIYHRRTLKTTQVPHVFTNLQKIILDI